jgi:hypothetical protein
MKLRIALLALHFDFFQRSRKKSTTMVMQTVEVVSSKFFQLRWKK